MKRKVSLDWVIEVWLNGYRFFGSIAANIKYNVSIKVIWAAAATLIKKHSKCINACQR